MFVELLLGLYTVTSFATEVGMRQHRLYDKYYYYTLYYACDVRVCL